LKTFIYKNMKFKIKYGQEIRFVVAIRETLQPHMQGCPALGFRHARRPLPGSRRQAGSRLTSGFCQKD
jgi:hypothetical protein